MIEITGTTEFMSVNQGYNTVFCGVAGKIALNCLGRLP